MCTCACLAVCWQDFCVFADTYSSHPCSRPCSRAHISARSALPKSNKPAAFFPASFYLFMFSLCNRFFFHSFHIKYRKKCVFNKQPSFSPSRAQGCDALLIAPCSTLHALVLMICLCVYFHACVPINRLFHVSWVMLPCFLFPPSGSCLSFFERRTLGNKGFSAEKQT